MTGMAQDAQPARAEQVQAEQVHSELEAAQEAVFEHTRLDARLSAARSALATARTSLAQATEALADEAADVRRLEDLSPALIWATMRGNRDERLAAERAEHLAAEYRVAAAQAAVRGAEQEHATVRADLDRLGDVAARRTRALTAKEAWVVAVGADGAAELTRLAAEVGTARGELSELRQVAGAAERACAALQGARQHLDDAGDWAAFDTFAGGGFLVDMMKREKMDQAVALMRTADEALRRLSRELGDLGRRGVGGIEIGALAGTFDVWFDDIFSDWTVMNRIGEARDRVRSAQDAVGQVHQEAADSAAALEARLGELGERREQLLTGG